MKKVLFLTTLAMLFGFSSCKDDAPIIPEVNIIEVDEYSTAQLLFSTIEYNLFTEEKMLAHANADDLGSILTTNSNMFCPSETNQVQSLIKNLETFVENLPADDQNSSLEKLRFLKQQFIFLETELDFDPYLFYLWKFEEELYYTTKAAMDPKLDLYEWGEFQMMVDCLNDDWQMVEGHYPSLDLLSYNKLGYKLQTLAKIQLRKSLNSFNTAVESDDHLRYELCDYGASLRTSYIKYLRTFVEQEEILEPFVASL